MSLGTSFSWSSRQCAGGGVGEERRKECFAECFESQKKQRAARRGKRRPHSSSLSVTVHLGRRRQRTLCVSTQTEKSHLALPSRVCGHAAEKREMDNNKQCLLSLHRPAGLSGRSPSRSFFRHCSFLSLGCIVNSFDTEKTGPASLPVQAIG